MDVGRNFRLIKKGTYMKNLSKSLKRNVGLLYMLHNVASKSEKSRPKFFCEFCDYNTSKINDWNKHIDTKKHNVACMLHPSCKEKARKVAKNLPTSMKVWNCDCGKEYKYHQSYYRHRKNCNYSNQSQSQNQIIAIDNKNDERIEQLINIIKQQQEQHAEERKELLNNIREIIPQIGNNNTTINNTINATNINVFLDTQCANALSIQEFASNLSITINELNMLFDNEPEVIASVIKNGLNGIKMTDRPMHTHKQKWYVKDKINGWEKDNDGKIIKTVKNNISHNSLHLLVKNAPEWETNEKQSEIYTETTAALLRDIDKRNQNKILRSIENQCKI